MDRIRATWTERIFALAMVVSVMTQLRVASVVGISEVLIILLGFLGKYSDSEPIPRYYAKQDQFLKWIFILMPIGLAWNLMTKAKFPQTGHDIFSWVFTAFLCLIVLKRLKIYENLLGIIYSYLFFETIANAIYIVMYFRGMGFYDENFERFEGLSLDPNQLTESMFLVPFISLFFINRVISLKPRNSFLCIVISVVCTASSLYVCWTTDSDSFTLSIVVGILTYLIYGTITAFVTRGSSKLILLGDIAGIVFLVLRYDYIVSYINRYVEETAEDANQFDVRKAVWKHGIDAFYNSPIFGNGPGSFSGRWAAFGGAESHNTYIYIMMDFGLIGLVLLLMLLFNAFKEINFTYSAELMGAFSSFLVFNFFHSFQRMALFWFFIYFFIAAGINEQQRIEQGSG